MLEHVYSSLVPNERLCLCERASERLCVFVAVCRQLSWARQSFIHFCLRVIVDVGCERVYTTVCTQRTIVVAVERGKKRNFLKIKRTTSMDDVERDCWRSNLWFWLKKKRETAAAHEHNLWESVNESRCGQHDGKVYHLIRRRWCTNKANNRLSGSCGA